MKAFLLAGGRGERLRPLTETLPKCLAPVNGVPLLSIWLDLCRREGITDVLLNVSHHSDAVRRHLQGEPAVPRVELVIEPAPLGSARTVREHRAFAGENESFWVFYADNLTDVALTPMRQAHERHEGVITMGVFHAPNPRAAGIVSMTPDGRITSFEEKPPHPVSDLANAGIYLARPALFAHIPDDAVDFGHDVLPRLGGLMHGVLLDGFLMDIGTPEALSRAQSAWVSTRGR